MPGSRGDRQRRVTRQHASRDAKAGDNDGDETHQAGDQEEGNGPAGGE